MALTIKVIDTTLESGGQKMIRGSILLDSSYPTGGETMDVSNWLKSGGSPTILLDGGSGAYVLRHNQGTSERLDPFQNLFSFSLWEAMYSLFFLFRPG